MDKFIKFSYKEYCEIIKHYAPIIKDFKEINFYTKDFCIIRHDVEFSIERAVEIAKIDSEVEFTSSLINFLRLMAIVGKAANTV